MPAVKASRPLQLSAALETLDATLVCGAIKGMPPGLQPLPLGAIGSLNLNVLRQDLAFPVAVLRQSALDGNRGWMKQFLERTGARIAPHAKTTMAPHLFALQLDDGAWGFTVATANQAAVLRRFGLPRILIANQVIGHANIDYLFSELTRDPTFELYATVDSPEALQLILERGVRFPKAAPIRLLIEVGLQGGRTGFRSLEDARKLAQAIAKANGPVVLRGVEAYESVFPGLTPPEKLVRVEQLMDLVLRLTADCSDAGWFGDGSIVLTAGGSEYFDRVVARLTEWHGAQAAEIVIRSGCYLAHDDLAYQRAYEALQSRRRDLADIRPRLVGALEVWAVVQSRPESDLALLTVGKRDISYDFELPVPKAWVRAGTETLCSLPSPDYSIARLNDQHAFLRCPPDTQLRVGDLVCLGISHPCTTFDKWNVIAVVDDSYTVCSAIRTFF